METCLSATGKAGSFIGASEIFSFFQLGPGVGSSFIGPGVGSLFISPVVGCSFIGPGVLIFSIGLSVTSAEVKS